MLKTGNTKDAGGEAMLEAKQGTSQLLSQLSLHDRATSSRPRAVNKGPSCSSSLPVNFPFYFLFVPWLIASALWGMLY